MVMMMSFGAILTISLIVFASYGVLYWLFGGGRPASATPAAEPKASSTPSWLTPVVLVGLVMFGLRSGIPFWLVLLGSVFAVVMLVKLNVLSFAEEARPAAPAPPPLPREPRFQNATHHATLAPPGKSRLGVFTTIVTLAAVVGFTMFSVVVMREDRVHAPRNLQMVAVDEWSGAMHEVHAEIQQGMQEFNHEVQSGAREIAKAAKETTRVFKMPPTQPPSVAVPTPPRTVVISPAMPPTQPERSNQVSGRTVAKTADSSKKSKKPPKPAPLPEVREPAVRVDYNLSPQELADWGTEKSPNGLYVILTDPRDPMDDDQAAYQRAVALLKNHLDARHPGVGVRSESLCLPSFAWCEANGLIHKRHEQVGDVRVHALGTNFSPKAMDLAYNYHLGCARTREAAKGYFGGLLVLGGLGLLLRIGTGIRPTAPVPSA